MVHIISPGDANYIAQPRLDENAVLEQIRDLLNQGAKPNATLSQIPVLNMAITHRYIKIVNLLMEFGANPNQQDTYGNTAIHQAIKMGYIDLVKMLLDKGTTDLYNKNYCGQTPLEYAKLEYDKTQEPNNILREPLKQIVNMLKSHMIIPTIKKHAKYQQIKDNMHRVFKSTKIPDDIKHIIRETVGNASQFRGGKSKSKRR